MLLSQWRRSAPSRESVSARVVGTVVSVLTALGTDEDPYCWIVWGEEPDVKYTILAPTRAGLALVAVRVNIPDEGPRANGKLIRWSRLQLSELTLESSAGHRLTAVQVEGQVLRGVDKEADAIASFVRTLIAAADGRDWQEPAGSAQRAGSRAPGPRQSRPRRSPRPRPAPYDFDEDVPLALPAGGIPTADRSPGPDDA